MDVVWRYLQLKKQYSPQIAAALRLTDVISAEIKGADLRSDLRSASRRRERRAVGLLDRVFDLLRDTHCRVVARVIVKAEDIPMEDRALYGSAISWICAAFHRYLDAQDRQGLVVLDSRTKVKNTPNSDVITTQKFRSGGDRLSRLVEVPVFGHSDSHVALQIADIVASAVLFPAACSAYCTELTWNQHVHAQYDVIRDRFGPRLREMQYRYYDDSTQQWRGGIYATGGRGGLPPTLLQPATPPSPMLPFTGTTHLTRGTETTHTVPISPRQVRETRQGAGD